MAGLLAPSAALVLEDMSGVRALGGMALSATRLLPTLSASRNGLATSGSSSSSGRRRVFHMAVAPSPSQTEPPSMGDPAAALAEPSASASTSSDLIPSKSTGAVPGYTAGSSFTASLEGVEASPLGKAVGKREAPLKAEELVFESTDDMRRWLRTKPRGFGELAARVQDTSLEDKLLAEMEAAEAAERRKAAEAKREKQQRQKQEGQSEGQAQRQAQAQGKGKDRGKGVLSQRGQVGAQGIAGLSGTEVPGSAKGAGGKAAGRAIGAMGGVQVRVSGLPKKRNIERDLRAALRSHNGLLAVTPSLQGSAKTRDPVCTGLATLSFSDLKSAQLFVERYNGSTPILFGKVERTIKCKLVQPLGLASAGGAGAGRVSGSPNAGSTVARLSAVSPPSASKTGRDFVRQSGSDGLAAGTAAANNRWDPAVAAAGGTAAVNATTVSKLRVRDKSFLGGQGGGQRDMHTAGSASPSVPVHTLSVRDLEAVETLVNELYPGNGSGASRAHEPGQGQAERDAKTSLRTSAEDAAWDEGEDEWEAEEEEDVWALLENEEDAEVEAELVREADLRAAYRTGTSALSWQAGAQHSELQSGAVSSYGDAEEGSIEEEEEWGVGEAEGVLEEEEEEQEGGGEEEEEEEVDSDWSELEDLSVDVVLASNEGEHLWVAPPAASGVPAQDELATAVTARAAAVDASATACVLTAAAAAAPESFGRSATEEGEGASGTKGREGSSVGAAVRGSVSSRGTQAQGQGQAPPVGVVARRGVSPRVATAEARIAALESRLLQGTNSRGTPQGEEPPSEGSEKREGGVRRGRGRGVQWSVEWDLDDDPPEEAIDAALAAAGIGPPLERSSPLRDVKDGAEGAPAAQQGGPPKKKAGGSGGTRERAGSSATRGAKGAKGRGKGGPKTDGAQGKQGRANENGPGSLKAGASGLLAQIASKYGHPV